MAGMDWKDTCLFAKASLFLFYRTLTSRRLETELFTLPEHVHINPTPQSGSCCYFLCVYVFDSLAFFIYCLFNVPGILSPYAVILVFSAFFHRMLLF